MSATSTNAASPLTIPTYEGSGQVVHPDVVDAGAGGWNGYRYWMVMTPYPGSDNDYENPSIVVSNDKTTWTVPAGLTNPVIAMPTAPAYNSDPDMLLKDGIMYMMYRVRNAANTQDTLYVTESSDGITWSAPVASINTTDKYQSAAIIHDGTQFVMFYHLISAVVSNLDGMYRRTASSIYGPWSDAEKMVLNFVLSHSHVDIVLSDGIYYGIFHTNDNKIYLGYSVGGIWWKLQASELLTVSAPGGWDDWGFYRTSLLRKAGGFDIWYTGKASINDWRVGYTEITDG